MNDGGGGGELDWKRLLRRLGQILSFFHFFSSSSNPFFIGVSTWLQGECAKKYCSMDVMYFLRVPERKKKSVHILKNCAEK